MDLEEIKRGLRAEIKKRENEQYFTFQCNVQQMCKDVLVKLEEQESVIAELKDKCQMHDFFWDGCGFAKRGFKNTIAVSEAFDRLEAENRRLKRALWLSRADRAMMTLDYFTLKCRWFKDYMKVEPPKCDVKMVHKWANIERKCRAKAEEYK